MKEMNMMTNETGAVSTARKRPVLNAVLAAANGSGHVAHELWDDEPGRALRALYTAVPRSAWIAKGLEVAAGGPTHLSISVGRVAVKLTDDDDFAHVALGAIKTTRRLADTVWQHVARDADGFVRLDAEGREKILAIAGSAQLAAVALALAELESELRVESGRGLPQTEIDPLD